MNYEKPRIIVSDAQSVTEWAIPEKGIVAVATQDASACSNNCGNGSYSKAYSYTNVDRHPLSIENVL